MGSASGPPSARRLRHGSVPRTHVASRHALPVRSRARSHTHPCFAILGDAKESRGAASCRVAAFISDAVTSRPSPALLTWLGAQPDDVLPLYTLTLSERSAAGSRKGHQAAAAAIWRRGPLGRRARTRLAPAGSCPWTIARRWRGRASRPRAWPPAGFAALATWCSPPPPMGGTLGMATLPGSSRWPDGCRPARHSLCDGGECRPKPGHLQRVADDPA